MDLSCEFGNPRRQLQFSADPDSGLISALLLDEQGRLLRSRVLDLDESRLVAKVIAAQSAGDQAILDLLPALFPD